MKVFFLFLISLALAVSVGAIDCNLIDNEDCEYIEESGVEDKDLLQANLVYDSSYLPNHDTILAWNEDIEITFAPEGVTKKSSSYISNAWVKIFTAMPSVVYDNIIYVPSNIEVLNDYGYSINLPSVTSGSWGECKRTYHLLSNSETFRLYRESDYVGNNKKQSVTINENSTLNANLEIEIKYQIKHYKENYICIKQCYMYCCNYGWVCEYDYSSIHTNSLEIDDYYNVSYYNENPELNFEVIEKYSGTNKVKVNSNNSYELSFDDGYYNNYKYFYNVIYGYKPYYFLYLQAKDINQTSSSNVVVSENRQYFNADECSIEYWDWFSDYENDCDLSYDELNLSIEIPKYKYELVEEIPIELYPKNTWINVSYAGENKLVQDNTFFHAREGFNKITATVGEIKAEKLIHVKKNKWWIIYAIATMLALKYIIYLILKKYWGDYVG